jgi:hypothetical protein
MPLTLASGLTVMNCHMAMQVFSAKVDKAYHITRGFGIATKREQRLSCTLWTDDGQTFPNG